MTNPLDSVRNELLALEPHGLLPINVDIAASALLVLGAVSDIQVHRPALVALCGEPMTASLDRLVILARATLQAQASYLALEGGAEVQDLSTQVGKFREGLLAEVRALIAREVLKPGVIGEVHGGRGSKQRCFDVLQLVSTLKADWDTASGQTGLTSLYIESAEAAAGALAAAVGNRNQASRSPAADLRQRAYTLMANTYDQARRMLTFLRWKQGDVDRIAPSLYRGRGGRGRRDRSKRDDDVIPQLEPVTPGR